MVSAETEEGAHIKAPAQYTTASSEKFLCTTWAEVCSTPDLNANLPGNGAVCRDRAATLALGGRGQDIGLAVRRLQGEMVMSVPAAAIQPEPQRIVFGRVPRDFETIAGFRIIDRRPAFANQAGKNLFTIPLRHG